MSKKELMLKGKLAEMSPVQGLNAFVVGFRLITFPPPPAPGGIQVTNEDLSCLEEGEFLNDVIIDFYLK